MFRPGLLCMQPRSTPGYRFPVRGSEAAYASTSGQGGLCVFAAQRTQTHKVPKFNIQGERPDRNTSCDSFTRGHFDVAMVPLARVCNIQNAMMQIDGRYPRM